MTSSSQTVLRIKTTLPYYLVLLLFTSFVYSNAIDGGFLLDDYPNIVLEPTINQKHLNTESIIKAFYESEAKYPSRGIARLTFFFEQLIFGHEPRHYKITNIIIHILNSILLFFLVLKLFELFDIKTNEKEKVFLAFIISLIWACHPINTSSVSYIVQRMNILSALFSILAFITYIHYRERYFSRLLILMPIITALGILSKENGALVFIQLLLLEYYLHRRKPVKETSRPLLFSFFVVTVLIPALVVTTFLLFSDWLDTSYAQRDFTMYERVLTQFRVIADYIRDIAIPNASNISILHDGYPKSTSIIQPISTLFCFSLIISLFVAAIISRKSQPLISFGVLSFFTGHLMESTVIPLELKFDHRNYLPSFGLILALITFITFIIRDEFTRKIICTLYATLTIVGGYTANNYWGNDRAFARLMVENSAYSGRAKFHLASLLIEDSLDLKNFNKAEELLNNTISTNPHETDSIFLLFDLSIIKNKPINNALFEQLLSRIERYPLTNSTIFNLELVSKKYTRLSRVLSKEKIRLIYDKALNKNDLTSDKKAFLYFSFAELLIKDQNYEAASFFLEEGIKVNPTREKTHCLLAKINAKQYSSFEECEIIN